LTDSQQVTTAVRLGWQMADLYQEALGPETEAPTDPTDLPGLSALSWEQLLRLRYHQVSSGLSRLAGTVTAGGLSVASLRASVGAATRDLETTEPSAPSANPPAPQAEQSAPGANPPAPQAETSAPAASEPRQPGHGSAAGATPPASSAAIRQKVLNWHVEILDTLTAADATVGKAYGLGRALADLTLRPATSSSAALQADFSGRVETIKGWLGDLRSLLPEHAGAAVQNSLDNWRKWVEETPASDPVWKLSPEWHDRQHPAATTSLVTEKLYNQGNLWRAVLTGEKQVMDMLNADDYVKASEALIQRLGTIGRRFWAQYRWGIILGVVVLGAVVAGLVLVPSNGTAGGLGALGAILAATGITWRGVSSTLGTALRKVEPALWGAQLDLVATVAITDLPGPAAVTLDVPKATGLSRSKQPPKLKLGQS
jgi:hypothetical protein